MAKFVPTGFDAEKVRDGLHRAMGFGEPNQTADKATFFTRTRPTTSSPTDGSGVPFDATVRNVPTVTGITVPCAVEFYDREGQAISSNGEIRPSRVKITILDTEWEQVKNFAFMTAAGDKYVRSTHQPVDALALVDVHTVWAVAEDER